VGSEGISKFKVKSSKSKVRTPLRSKASVGSLFRISNFQFRIDAQPL
jgi:hypothetical protein